MACWTCWKSFDPGTRQYGHASLMSGSLRSTWLTAGFGGIDVRDYVLAAMWCAPALLGNSADASFRPGDWRVTLSTSDDKGWFLRAWSRLYYNGCWWNKQFAACRNLEFMWEQHICGIQEFGILCGSNICNGHLWSTGCCCI